MLLPPSHMRIVTKRARNRSWQKRLPSGSATPPRFLGLDSPGHTFIDNPPSDFGYWVFAGDLHGDWRATSRLVDFVSANPNYRLCFLGDLFDRGLDEWRCFHCLLNFAHRFPNRALWLAGNHDTPEAAPWSQSRNSEMLLLRQQLVPRLPRFAILGSGVAAVHAGLPTKVALRACAHDSASADTLCQRSFLTARYAPRATTKYDAELTFTPADVCYFSHQIGIPGGISLLIRGHDHPGSGVEWNYETDDLRILSLLASTQVGNVWNKPQWRTSVAVALWRPGHDLTIVKLPIV